MTLHGKDFSLAVDFAAGAITSLVIRGRERLASQSPLFTIRLRDRSGEAKILSVYDAKTCQALENGARYTDFSNAELSVDVFLTLEQGEAAWRIAVTPKNDAYFVEWVDFPPITLPKLTGNNPQGNGGTILFPYNEGVIISDIDQREGMWLKHSDAEYPSLGCYTIFPNMVCSQMLAYLWEDAGLYIGAHDEQRGVKEIDFLKETDGVTLRMRLFCGTDFGQPFATAYPIVFAVTEGRWESAAQRYRQWFEATLPGNVKKAAENTALPQWYANSPLIVTYPVRGVHDMDEMEPNKLYPYTNALPLLEQIRSACDSQLLVLLMHWEGTAPWAPPYVWPPFGGPENFTAFMDALHEKGDLLGVYCSGFGYTIQSNLIESYNQAAEYAEKGLEKAMCAGPDGKVAISNICTFQRSGYDICPGSALGEALLKKAYTPLLEQGLDYVQILDQNHGGGQYFCYSREHGHPPAPGSWMTEKMQKMLADWNTIGKNTLLGCESAAAEPFIGNLQFSDNRFELNYMIGTPVPLYGYLYHEYLRNFMGNQVCCPFRIEEDTLRYRLGYSFSAGDSMTLVVTQDGDLASHWGVRDFSYPSHKEQTFRLIANLTRFYRSQGKPYLFAGRMIPGPSVECETVTFGKNDGKDFAFPAVFSSAWQSPEGDRALVLVNPGDKAALCSVNGEQISVPALDAILLPLS